MKWQGVIAIGAVLAVSILAIVDYCPNVDINWDEVIAIGAVLAASIALLVYTKDKYWNTYRYLADLYYEILRRGLEQPEFLNPEYTRKYKELQASNSKMYFKYDAYAKMCWTHIYDIHDTKELKKDFIELYLPTIGRYNRLHGVWLLDHTSAFDSGFVDFVLSYKWRDYLGKGAAGWVRWENVVDDFDGKILNLHLKKVNKCLFDCIEDYIKKYLKKRKNKVFVADFGCGNRKLIKRLANEFGIDNVYGIDYPDNMLEMAKKRGNLSKVSYLFSWDDVPGNDDERLLRYLKDNHDIGWAKNVEISKSDDKMTISILKDGNSAEIAKITLDETEEKATLKITDGKTYVLKVKEENGKLNIYKVSYKTIDMTNMVEMKKIDEKIDIAFSINSILPRNPNATPIILDEIFDILKPGGLFIAIFPSFDTVLALKVLWYKCRIEDCKHRIKKYVLNKRWNSKTRNDEESIICKLGQYARFYIFIYHLILSNYIKNFGSKCKTKLETMLEFDKHHKLNVRFLFSVEVKLEAELKNGSISDELKKKFKNKRETLPDNATVKKEEEEEWVITEYNEKKFIIRKEDGELNIYKVRKPLDAEDFLNVHPFIYDKYPQPLLKKAGFKIRHMEKVTYLPYELCKEYDYNYFPEEEIWDWFVVAEKLKKEN